MASNGEINQAYASIAQAFANDTKPRINSLIQRSQTASWDEIGGDITSVRNDLESIYSQINDLINQAKANSPRDTNLIGRMETSLNTNRGTNLSLIAQAEARARSNQDPPPQPEDSETIGEEPPANEAKTVDEASDENSENNVQSTNSVTSTDDEGNPIESEGNGVETSGTLSEEGATADDIADQTQGANQLATADDIAGQTERGGKSIESKQPSIPQIPIENPLHSYDSYTYSLSLYILSMDDYAQISDSGIYTPKASNLLVSSAGRQGLNKNPHFQTDFYFEDLEFTTVLANAPQNKNSNLITGSFKIIEPLGFTFINRLISAADGVIGVTSPRYEQQPYVLKLDFYGIKDGEMKPTPIELNGVSTTKYFPIAITNMSAEVTEKGGEYKIDFVPFSHQSLLDRNMIVQTDFQIEGLTVEDFLGSNESNSKPKSLSSQLIKYNEQLKQKYKSDSGSKVYFEIDPEIAKSKVILKKSSVQNQATSTYKTNETSIKLTSGQRLDSIIDYIIRNSEYFTNQVTTDKEKNSSDTPLRTFKVLPKIKHIGYNKTLNSYIYETTYVIKPYVVTSNHSEGIKPKPDGSVKEYNYFFSGKNVDILEFKINFNLLYFQTISAFKSSRSVIEGQSGASKTENENLQSGDGASKDKNQGPRDALETKLASPSSAPVNKTAMSTNSGADSAVSDTAAHVAIDLLNTPTGDLVNINVKIIGDPLFIKQDDFFYSPTVQEDRTQALTKNSSFIMDRGELYVLLKFNSPQDYKEETGLTDLSNNTYSYSDFSGFYKIITIKNFFSNGKFEQSLDLVRVFVDKDILAKVKEKEVQLDAVRDKHVQTLMGIGIPTSPSVESFLPQVKAIAAKAQGGGDLNALISKVAGSSVVGASIGGLVGGQSGAITGALAGATIGALTDGQNPLSDIASGVGDSVNRLANGIGLPTGISPSSAVGSIGDGINLQSGLYSNTSDSELTYSGDDPIVLNRINRERIGRGLPPIGPLE